MSYKADGFDCRLGAPRLHRVGWWTAKVERKTILLPGQFAQFLGDAILRMEAH